MASTGKCSGDFRKRFAKSQGRIGLQDGLRGAHHGPFLTGTGRTQLTAEEGLVGSGRVCPSRRHRAGVEPTGGKHVMTQAGAPPALLREMCHLWNDQAGCVRSF